MKTWCSLMISVFTIPYLSLGYPSHVASIPLTQAATYINRVLSKLLFIFHSYTFGVCSFSYFFSLFECLLFNSWINFLPAYLKSVVIVPVFLSHIKLLESSSTTFKSYVYVRGIKRFKFQYLLNESNYPTSSIWIHCYCSSLIYSRFSSIVILINKIPSERVFSFYFLNKSPLSGLFYKF